MKVSIKQYSQTLFDLTDGKSEQEILNVVKNFASVLKKEGQMKNATRIITKFAEIYNAKNSIVSAEVITSKKSENISTKEIEEFIKKKYGAKEIEMKITVDEKIKGGIVIKVGDEVMDASVANQLKKLKNILSK